MVTNLSRSGRRSFMVLPLLGALIFALASCSESSGAHPSGASASTASVASSEPTVMPSPALDCHGIRDLSDVSNLIGIGRAAAFAKLTIGEQSSATEVDRTVQVTSAELLAGTLSNGDVRSLSLEPIIDGFDPFPAGDYYVLIGPVGDSPGTYFVSNGLRGSFLSDGDQVFERCPNFEDPKTPNVVKSGVTNRDQLVDMIQTGFRQTETQ